MKEIAIIPCAGLCNRMRAIASRVYVSKRYNTPIEQEFIGIKKWD